MRPLDDLRIDARSEFSIAAVKFDDSLHVRLDLGAREDGARPDLDFLGEILVADLRVTLEHHLVDDGVFGDADGQRAGAGLEAGLDVGEKPGGGQRLQRLVNVGGRIIVAFTHADIGQNRAGFDALGAPHHNMLDDTWRGWYRCHGGGGIGSRGGGFVAGGPLAVEFLRALGGAGTQLRSHRRGRQCQAKAR